MFYATGYSPNALFTQTIYANAQYLQQDVTLKIREELMGLHKTGNVDIVYGKEWVQLLLVRGCS